MRKISVLLISLGFLFVLSFVLLILHLFSGPSSDAQSPSQVPAHVQDEIIVKFRKGVPEGNKELARYCNTCQHCSEKSALHHNSLSSGQ